MSNTTRVKINVKTGEIEFEGSEKFVEKKLAELKGLMDLISSSLPEGGIGKAGYASAEESGIETAKIQGKQEIQVTKDFGEWYHKFPGKLLQTDQVLIAGYFTQRNSSDDIFKTSQANMLLKNQSIKVANATGSLKQLQDAKRVFVVKKEGRIGLFRVSDKGQEYLSELLNKRK